MFIDKVVSICIHNFNNVVTFPILQDKKSCSLEIKNQVYINYLFIYYKNQFSTVPVRRDARAVRHEQENVRVLGSTDGS